MQSLATNRHGLQPSRPTPQRYCNARLKPIPLKYISMTPGATQPSGKFSRATGRPYGLGNYKQRSWSASGMSTHIKWHQVPCRCQCQCVPSSWCCCLNNQPCISCAAGRRSSPVWTMRIHVAANVLLRPAIHRENSVKPIRPDYLGLVLAPHACSIRICRMRASMSWKEPCWHTTYERATKRIVWNKTAIRHYSQFHEAPSCRFVPCQGICNVVTFIQRRCKFHYSGPSAKQTVLHIICSHSYFCKG